MLSETLLADPAMDAISSKALEVSLRQLDEKLNAFRVPFISN